MTTSDCPDCTACGCCCFSSAADYIAVFAVDEARMDEAALALTQVTGDRRSMRFEDGRCSALRIDGGRFVCSIYPMRPDACRWLVPASGACLEHIRDKSEAADRFATRRSTIHLRTL